MQSVINSLLRVENVSGKAPDGFDLITHKNGDFWVYELPENKNIEDWMIIVTPILYNLACCLDKIKNTKVYLHVATEFGCDSKNGVTIFQKEFISALFLLKASLEHHASYENSKTA
jgi:hypothetical protein